MLEQVHGCPGAVRLYDCFEDERSVQLVMELCRGGDLKKYVEVRQRQAGENAALHFAAGQVACVGSGAGSVVCQRR